MIAGRILLVAVLLTSARAVADSPIALAVECPDAEQTRHMARVELGNALIEPLDPRIAPVRAHVRCEGTTVHVRVDNFESGSSVSRSLELGEESARSRLIALALAEMVSASWSDAIAPPSAVVSRPGWTPSYRAMLLVGATRFSADTDVLPGAGLRMESESTGRFGWMLDMQVHRETETVSLGDVSTELLAFGGAFRVHAQLGGARIDGGIGVRGGSARIAGTAMSTSARGSSFWSTWFGPMLRGGLAIPLGPRIAVAGALEAGTVVSPVTATADGQRVVAIDGVWLQLQLGIAFTL